MKTKTGKFTTIVRQVGKPAEMRSFASKIDACRFLYANMIHPGRCYDCELKQGACLYDADVKGGEGGHLVLRKVRSTARAPKEQDLFIETESISVVRLMD